MDREGWALMDQETGNANDQLMFDVVSTLVMNARRVGQIALDEAEAAGDPDLVRAVSAALSTETEAIVAGCDPANIPLIRAVEGAGRAINAVAVQALRTGVHPPAESLSRALDLFASYISGPGRTQIVAP